MSKKQKKRILILATDPAWIAISRLPFALKRAQLEVCAYCPRNSYLAQSESLDVCHTYFKAFRRLPKFFYITALLQIRKSGADIIIPGDEQAALLLQQLANASRTIPFLKHTHRLIRDSLYPRSTDPIVLHKEAFIERCHQWEVRAPENIPIRDHNDAMEKARALGYPVMLKASHGSGGSGVHICRSEKELSAKLQSLLPQHVPLTTQFMRAVKNLVFINSLDGYRRQFSLQQYVPGSVGMCPFVALNGVLLAANPMLKVRCHPPPTGPSSVVKGYNDPEIVSFVRTLVQQLGYSGFGSIDFVIGEDGKAYVIELNPRPVPVSHFSGEFGNDLALCFGLALNGSRVPRSAFHEFLVALYPNELRRDPDSEFIRDAHHDVPLAEPRLREALKRVN